MGRLRGACAVGVVAIVGGGGGVVTIVVFRAWRGVKVCRRYA